MNYEDLILIRLIPLAVRSPTTKAVGSNFYNIFGTNGFSRWCGKCKKTWQKESPVEVLDLSELVINKMVKGHALKPELIYQ
jgi:hypothetical protein